MQIEVRLEDDLARPTLTAPIGADGSRRGSRRRLRGVLRIVRKPARGNSLDARPGRLGRYGDLMDPVSTWIGVVAASVSAVAAIAAWCAAAASNQTAREMARIESDRRHRELTPDIKATISATTGGMFRVNIRLDGPLDLRALDRVTVAVRNDTIDHTPLSAGNVTIDEANEHIWGPLRFTPGVDGARGNGRRVGPVPLRVGDDRPFQMELSTAPSWSGDDGHLWWRNAYQRGGVPVRLAVTCERDGEAAWEIPLELHPSLYEFPNTDVQR